MNNLVRLGNDEYVGYIFHKAEKDYENLISFGIAEDISFEQDFNKLYPNTKISGFDPSIDKLIPENTFIDYRKFNSLQDLNDYLTKMKPNEYSDYLKNINRYLSSSLCREFDVKVNAKRVSKIIYESLNKKI